MHIMYGVRKELSERRIMTNPCLMKYCKGLYSLMYMTEETQQSAICEASRVLKAGGTMHIWDCDIGSAFPDPFVVDLDIRSGDKRIRTSYGIVKADAQSSDSVIRLLEQAGLGIIFLKENNEQFHIQCRKE